VADGARAAGGTRRRTGEGVTHLRLWPQLDKGGWPCRATLTQEERR